MRRLTILEHGWEGKEEYLAKISEQMEKSLNEESTQAGCKDACHYESVPLLRQFSLWISRAASAQTRQK